jgi:hypothetical protein
MMEGYDGRVALIKNARQTRPTALREAPVGGVCVIPERHLAACLGQRMMPYRPNQPLIDPHYFLYVLQTRQIQNRIASALDSISEELRSDLAQREKVRQKKSGLMHDLLTGKVPVKVEEPDMDLAT